MEENKKNKIPNVPTLRFNSFTSSYVRTKLSRHLKTNPERNKNKFFSKYDVLSVSGEIGVVNQIKHLGRSYAGESVAPYHILKVGQIVYTKSPLAESPYGIIKLNRFEDGIVSTLYAVYDVLNNSDGKYIEHYFSYKPRLNNYLRPIVRIGAKHDMKIGNDEVLDNYVYFPEKSEQEKIAQFLDFLDERISTQNKIIEEYQALKNCIIDAIILKSRKIGTCKINKIIEEYNVKTTNDNEYPVLSSTASGIYFQNEYFNKEAASENTTGYKCVPKGYCAYRSMSDTGRFYFNMQSITDVGIVSPAYPVFSVKEDSALFLVSVLNRDKNIIKEILKLKAGGTRFSLPFKKLVELEIPWPDHQTRKHFMKIIRNMIQKIDLEQKILAKYIDQKSYLLNNMFI